MPELINIAIICKEYGWTYDEYMNQPSDFLDAILAKSQVESVLQKRENDKLEREMKQVRARSGRR